jgi:DNA mismatch repair protein MutS
MNPGVFELDKQTLGDLAIFPDGDGVSVLNLFDQPVTFGGRDKLKDIFNAPLTNRDQIEQRIEAIKYLSDVEISFKMDNRLCDYIEYYLSRYNKPTSVSKIKAIERKVMHFLTGDIDYYVINQGIASTLELLKGLDDFAVFESHKAIPKLVSEFRSTIREIFEDAVFVFVKDLFEKKKLSAIDIARADHLFRYSGYENLKVLLDIVYQLDVFIAAGMPGKTLGFSFPVINKSGEQVLKLDGLFHPFITNPVANNVEFNHNKNICFVTGANMAGKSTFLKSVGICVYLSQLGFPVPAAYMETSVFDGLISTINLADNITGGNSHFYTEVSRVKHVAQKMAQSQNMMVIFDELFRGTNVKDAFDASLAIVSAFSKLRKSFFIISTHIVEVANELAAIDNINFKFMETRFENDVPSYSYQLQDGITEERLGMWIVKNEGIVEIIEKIINEDSD